MKLKVLFVCLGNICRSPGAEAVFKAQVKEQGLEDKIAVDSAGTSGYHEGEPADERMQKHAAKRGYKLEGIARQVRPSDLENFDILVAMDNSNYHNLMNMAKSPSEKNKISLMTDFSQKFQGEVPDPYFGGEKGFEQVLDILEESTKGLLEEIKSDYL